MDENIDLTKNTELNDALKEFEAKSQVEQKPQKQAVETLGEVSGMAKWVVKLSGGKITEQRQAEYVLLGFVILAIAISVFLFFGEGSNSSSNNKLPIYQEDLTPTARATIPEDILKTIPYKYAK